MLLHWPSQKSETSSWVWRYLLHQPSDSKLPRLKNRQRNSHSWQPQLRELLISMVMKLSHQLPVITRPPHMRQRRSGVWGQFPQQTCTYGQIIYMSHLMTLKRQGTLIFCQRMCLRNSLLYQTWELRLQDIYMELVPLITLRWRRSDVLWCHLSGELTRPSIYQIFCQIMSTLR